MDIDNILLSNKISSGEKNYKYFIGYVVDNYRIKPLHLRLPKTRYVKVIVKLDVFLTWRWRIVKKIWWYLLK